MRSRTIHRGVVLCCLFGSFVLAGPKDVSRVAIEKVRSLALDCQRCSFFAVTQENPLINNHELFVVSTLDRLPPPFWTVAVSKTLNAHVLDTDHVSSWNRMIEAEKLTLQSDEDAKKFAKAFVELVVGYSMYVDNLLAAEMNRVKTKMNPPPPTGLKIVRIHNRMLLSFFARSVLGAVQWWNVTVEKSGQILKADVREF